MRAKCYLTASTERESTMQVPQGKARVPLSPAHPRCNYHHQRGVNILGAASTRSIAIHRHSHSRLHHHQDPGCCVGVQVRAKLQVEHTHTHSYCNTIPLRTSTVCHMYFVSIVGAVIGPVLCRSYLCVWVPSLPSRQAHSN